MIRRPPRSTLFPTRRSSDLTGWAAMSLVYQERLRPSLAVRASVSGDGLILLDVDGGLVLSSNAVGARIWQLIEQHRTADEIARQLVDDYAVPADRALRDVHAFVADLKARRLVPRDPPPSTPTLRAPR